MFLDYNQRILWAPEFYTAVYQDTFFFFSEKHQYAIPAKQLELVHRCVESAIPLNQFFQKMKPEEKMLAFQTADTLHAKGLLVNTEDGSWLSADPESGPEALHHNDTVIYDLCGVAQHAETLALLRDVIEQYGCNLIVISDYLDPKIKQLKLVDNGNPYLFVNLTNRRHYLGPVIEVDGFCHECFQQSISRNQPLRHWFDSYSGSKVSIPFKFLPLKGEKKRELSLAVESLLNDGDSHQIVQLSPKVQTHALHRFDGCCNGQDTSDADSEMVLSSCLKSDNAQGGYRHISPEETLANIQHLVSDFTGLISTSSEVKDKNGLPYQTFKSSFFRKVPEFSHPLSYGTELTSLGKGSTSVQAEVSSLCESFERYAAHAQGNEKTLVSSFTALGGDAVHPELLIGLSDKQKQSYEEFDYPAKKSSHGSIPFAEERELNWSPAWSLTQNKTVYLPSSYLYAGAAPDIKYCSWNSNGCAAGNTVEEAILQGFLEVVERDAIAMWWYNKLNLPAVDLTLLPDEQRERIDQTLSGSWDYWVLDTTNDFQIPVFAALAKNKQTGGIMFGFGCHLSPEIAIERAITELCQLISVADEHSAPFDFNEIGQEAYLFPDPQSALKKKDSFPHIENRDLLDDVNYCLEKTKQLGLNVLVTDYKRPELPVETIKVTVPGTCHMWPQFALERLYSVPVKLGLIDQELSESQLNQHMLYV